LDRIREGANPSGVDIPTKEIIKKVRAVHLQLRCRCSSEQPS